MRRALLLSAAVGLALLPSRGAALDELAVVYSGKPRGAVEYYKAGSVVYLDAASAGELYDGQVQWYPVSGRVQLSLRGRALQFMIESDKARAGDVELTLPRPVLLRASRAFIPVDFLAGDDFSRWSGYETRYDDRTRTLVIEKKGTVGSPKAFSYKGFTRVSVELAPGASWRSAARGTGAAELVVDYGVAEGDDSSKLEDGVVESFALKQEARLARLSVRFAETGLKWRARELEDPRRAVIEVFAPGVEPSDEPAATARRPAIADPKPDSKEGLRVQPEMRAVPQAEMKKRRLVVVDPGHGGKDPGATGRRGTREKDVNLAAALQLAKVLRERGDFDVALTREQDVFVPLSERSELANGREADLFVSLHCNAAGNKRETGFEVYSVSETASDPAAERLAAAENAALELEGKDPEGENAKLILLAMTKTEMINESAAFAALAARALDRRVDVDNRGAKQAAFYVLRGTHAPAILVEMAFLTHAEDEARLASRRFRGKMAEGIAAGIAEYAKRQGWL